MEADVALPAAEIGTCPWCHNPVTIDPLLLQQVCPGCNARFATDAARAQGHARARRWPARRSKPATRAVAALLCFALLAVLLGTGALLPTALITMCVIGLMVALEERP